LPFQDPENQQCFAAIRQPLIPKGGLLTLDSAVIKQFYSFRKTLRYKRIVWFI